MGKEPDEIRQEIEDTRARMGETVEAIGYKADVPARARDNVQEKKDNLVQSVTGVKERLVGSIVGSKESVGGSMSNVGSSISESISGAGQSVAEGSRAVATRVGDVTPSAQDLRQGVQRTAGLAQENPLGLALGSVAVGFIAGLMIPATRVERQKIGPIADQVVDKARETGQEALDRGKQVAQEAAQTARQVAEETKNTAQEAAQRGVEDLRNSAQEQGQEFALSAQQNATDLTGSSGGSTQQSDSGTSEFPPIAGGGMTTEGPEITGNDMIGGHTGIAGTGALTEDADGARHNPGGTPTI